MVPIFIGYDPRESACFHVLQQSILAHTSIPVAIIPLHPPMLMGFDGQRDGTNAFTYSRFLVPYLADYQGWALYMDSDMLVRADLAKLWDLRDDSKALMVVKHDYESHVTTKLIGTPMEARNENYPKKNQSSLMLWNCGHPMNRILNPEWVAEMPGKTLHRFEWLDDSLVGELGSTWNHLAGELPPNPSAFVVHYTLGSPGFVYYRNAEHAEEWRRSFDRVVRMDDFASPLKAVV